MNEKRSLSWRQILAAVVLPACTAAPAAQESGEAIDYEYWAVEFPTSGSAEAHQHFIHGLTAMHLYMFEDAADEFRRAQAIEPGFGMAYWGEALTHYRPIWREWEPEEARAILTKLGASAEERAARAPTDREKAYLAAIELLFADGPPPDPSETREAHSRLVAYERAMRQIVDAHPDDVEALALWAGSRVVMFPRTERAMRDRMETAAAAKEVLLRNPKHPGAARYLLQSTDDPVHASIGWEGAEVFMNAPARSTDATAQHMPSHTFAQLGRWAEMAESNMQAFRTSMEWTERRGFRLQDLNNHNYGHLLNYGQYGFLQSGQHTRAREIIDQAERDYEASGKVREIANTFRSAITLYVGETGDADGLQRLQELAAEEGWSGEREVHYALALAGARTGDLQLARAALPHLEDARDAAGRIMRNQVAALIAAGQGEQARALELMREASTIEEERLYSHFGPPSPIRPAHELYGELLLEASRPAEALEAFESSLWIFSRRPASLLGAARAAAAAGQQDLASNNFDELERILAGADPEVKEAYTSWRTS